VLVAKHQVDQCILFYSSVKGEDYFSITIKHNRSLLLVGKKGSTLARGDVFHFCIELDYVITFGHHCCIFEFREALEM